MERLRLVIRLAAIVTELKKTLAEQRSEAWYAIRRFRVGASEIGTLLGRNKNERVRDLIAKKVFDPRAPHQTSLGHIPKYLNLACAWGTLFEDCVRNYCEHVYRTVIHEVGSVEGRPGQSCSVDGLGVVDTDLGPQIALFEYKCPLSRAIVEGEVPAYYLPQVLTGMNTLPYCTVAIFIEANIKRCALGEPGHTLRYEGGLAGSGGTHPRCRVPPMPYTWGAFVYMAPRAPADDVPGAAALRRLLDGRGRHGGTALPIDFGTCSRDRFDDMMRAFTEHLIVAEPLYQGYADEGDDTVTPGDILGMAAAAMNDARVATPGAEIVGVLRWKMMQLNTVIVDPVEGYVDALYPMIQIVNDTVKACDMMDDDQARLRAIDAAAEKIDAMGAGFPF